MSRSIEKILILGALLGAAGLVGYSFLQKPESPVTPPPTQPDSTSTPTTAKKPFPPKKEGFDDHTVEVIPDMDAFFQFAAKGAGANRELKFLIEDFKNKPTLHLMDGTFYRLHDEWYWFRLLNGQPVRETKTREMGKHDLKTIDAVYAWAREQKELPVNLGWVEDGRLYSQYFYEISLAFPRDFGLGTILYIPNREGANATPARFAFELEYNDVITYDELLVFWKLLREGLPEEIFSQLRWLVRSPAQEKLAQEMEAEKSKYSDRIMRYSELVIPGEVEVYGAGITAGHLRQVKDIDQVATFPTDILVMKDIPDWLPPASGLLTAVPQTPLAHIALLARNRGIPNAYRGGLYDDPSLEQMAAGYAPVIIRAQAPDQLEIVQISEEEFQSWYELVYPTLSGAPPVDYSGAKNAYLLSTLSLSDVEKLRPLLGGKNAGFLTMQAAKITMPENPVGISIKPYWEHLKSLQPTIDQMLICGDFIADPKARYLALEGPKSYDKRYKNTDDKVLKEKIYAKYTEETPLGKLFRRGLRNLIEDKPLDPATLSDIRATLLSAFGTYAKKQGLRFRSSSTIEDIEGFNGAGLYESYTGYLYPDAVEEKDQKQTIEWALKHTWSSYWGYEAFQERETAAVNHLSGGMGVLVHANFQDDLEDANGVFTLTIFPEGFEEYAAMELNVQKGALSVTNPEAKDDALPEVDRVFLRRGETVPIVTRKKLSTKAEGQALLDDETLRQIFTQAVAVTETALSQQNASLSKEQQGRTLTLDFEFRKVAAGWPALETAEPLPARVVIKQARSLEPKVSLPAVLRAAPAPRDVLARTSKAVRRVLRTDAFQLTVLQIYTDPLKTPDLGYATIPFTAEIKIETIENLPEINRKKAEVVSIPYTAWTGVSYPGGLTDTSWSINVTLTEEQAKALGVSAIEVSTDGTYQIMAGANKLSGKAPETRSDTIFSTPEIYLLDLLAAKKAEKKK